MAFRLVIDAVRRKWLLGAFAAFQLHILAQPIGQFFPSVNRMALAMSGAWFLSMIVGEVFSSRVLYQLPVSRRTWWLARWWISVGVSVLIAHLAGSFTQWRAGLPPFGVEVTLLSLLFGILYCGVSMAVRTTSIGTSVDEPGTFLSTVAYIPAMILFVAAPFLLSPYLPHSFADLHTVWIGVLVVMAAITVVGYLHHPAISARPDMRIARRIPPVTPALSGSPVAPRVDPAPVGFLARLTGAKMVLWEECRKQFFIFSTVIAIGVAWWAIGSQFRPWPPLGVVLRKASMLSFHDAGGSFIELFILTCLVVIATFTGVWMTDRIRMLRTLPVSSSQLGSIPVLLGVVSATMLWLVLVILHGLVQWSLPDSLRPDLFIAFAAFTAVTHTVRFVAPGQAATKGILGFAPVAAIWLTLAYIADSTWRPVLPQVALLVGSLLALAASWVVMRLAVMRSSAMYRPPPAVPTT